MSRGYRIQLEPLQVVRGTVTASDELCVGLDVLPILSDEEMRDLVRQTLREKGWKQEGDGSLSKDLGDGAKATLDEDGKKVTVTLTTSQGITGAGRTTQEANAALAGQKETAEEAAKRRATQRLTAAEPGIRAELDEAVQKIYVEALKKKAQRMGQVESMEESRSADGSMQITIKVKA